LLIAVGSGWADNLSAGGGLEFANGSLFNCKIWLTEEGNRAFLCPSGYAQEEVSSTCSFLGLSL
jgi:hypothetical protein